MRRTASNGVKHKMETQENSRIDAVARAGSYRESRSRDVPMIDCDPFP
jgi:hypothetical protein